MSYAPSFAISDFVTKDFPASTEKFHLGSNDFQVILALKCERVAREIASQ